LWYSPGRSSTGPPRDAYRDTVWRFLVNFFCTGGAGSVTVALMGQNQIGPIDVGVLRTTR
jgi:hypothetical protein